MNPFLVDAAPLAAGVMILFSSILCAQAPKVATCKTADPAVAALLAKVAAQRGIAAGKAPTLAIEGTYTVEMPVEGKSQQVATGKFTQLYSGDSLARSTSDMGAMGAMENGVHGDVVWSIDPMMGAKVLRGTDAAAARRHAGILRGEDPRNVYTEVARTGTETVDGRECAVLRMMPIEGTPDTWFVDADGNVARVSIKLPAPESANATFGLDDTMESRITFSDWRQVDGGRFAFRYVLDMGTATVTSTCTKIEVGGKIDAAKFAPPAAVEKERAKKDTTGPAFDKDGNPTYQIVDRPVQAVASIRVKIKPNEISGALSKILPEVYTHVTASGAALAGPPFSRYHAVSDTEIDIEAGMPVHKPVTETSRIKNSELPAGRTVTCWHVGPYEKLAAAHDGLQAHLAAQKLAPRGGCWEIYWTDPGMVQDESKWKTQLFAPVK